MLLIKLVYSAYGNFAQEDWTLHTTPSTSYLNTIGANFNVISMNVRGETVRFQLWQLATHSRFVNIRNLYCRGATGGVFIFPFSSPEIPIQSIRDALRELWNSCGRGAIPALIVLVNPMTETVGEIDKLEQYSERLVQLKNEFGDLVSFWITPKQGLTENRNCLVHLGEKIIEYINNPLSLSNEFGKIFPKKSLPRKEILLQWLEKILPISSWDFEKNLTIVSPLGLYKINPLSTRVYLTPKKCQKCKNKCSMAQRYVCIDLEGWKGWNNCDLNDIELLLLTKVWTIANNKYNTSIQKKIKAALKIPCSKSKTSF